MINLHEIFSFQFFSVVSLNIVLLIIFSSGKIVTLRRQSFVAKSDLTVTRLHRVQQTRLNKCGILFSTSLSLRNECQALELYVQMFNVNIKNVYFYVIRCMSESIFKITDDSFQNIFHTKIDFKNVLIIFSNHVCPKIFFLTFSFRSELPLKFLNNISQTR